MITSQVLIIITLSFWRHELTDNTAPSTHVLTVSSQDRTRNNDFKLEKCRFSKEIGLAWFTNRVVDDWNRLSQQVVSAQTIGTIGFLTQFFINIIISDSYLGLTYLIIGLIC